MEEKYILLNSTADYHCSIPRIVADLHQSKIFTESVYRVVNTEVMWIDEELIHSDFPTLNHTSQIVLSDWILSQSSFLSTTQAMPNNVNQTVSVESEPVCMLRLPRYGRAGIVEAQSPNGKLLGLLDLKGVGISNNRSPSPTLDNDGLLFAPAAICELFFELLIAKIAILFDKNLYTNPTYAILWLNFRGRSGSEGGRELPAAQLVRRAHVRPPGNIDLPNSDPSSYFLHLACELFLRQFGITSTSPPTSLHVEMEFGRVNLTYGGNTKMAIPLEWMRRLYHGDINTKEFDCNNIQMCPRVSGKLITLYDFGQYSLRSSFTRPLVQLADDLPLNWATCIDTDHDVFAKGIPDGPDKLKTFLKRELPYEICSHFSLSQRYFSLVRHLGFYIAYKFERGDINTAGIEAIMESSVSIVADEISQRCSKNQVLQIHEILTKLETM